ncbi:uncharacterized protein KGF55_004762 [Candida pseudojiufengensis]|uniref:uncharacterized protein n=1 Tax=Candida pseudojiufengensis TaxID=497109 RepID=UPI002225224D|nr:uncharacterized protein KGF55_004762 [Candida pseudojiufengensis]KAI5960039.1 hypothetical protein KGF55_004762 [Candida pseudojiufengensis]
MEKLIYFSIEVLEIIFQQINHHMALSLMPLHSKFYEIGKKKLYKNIHIYHKDKLIETSRRETNGETHIEGYEWRAHKDILNDFTKKFTVISSYNFYRNIIRKKMIRNQHIQHLSIEKVHPVEYTGYMSYKDRKKVPALLKEAFRYFKHIDYVSFAFLNNQINMNNENCFNDVLKSLDFLIPNYIPGFYGHTLFLEKNNQGSFDFLYDNLKSLKFLFSGSNVREYEDEENLSESIELFNKVNLFKNLEELHLKFESLIDLTDSSLLAKLNKIKCKLKKLDLVFWGKIRSLEDTWNRGWKPPKPEPKKWLFTLKNFFDTDEINSLSLNYNNSSRSHGDELFCQKFEFNEILTNANLSNLRNLVLFSHSLDLDSITIKNLHKLILCTDIANDEYATEIAKLYLENPALKVCWWPRFMSSSSDAIFFNSENLRLYSPDYFKIISCQWPSYFFKNKIISIEKGTLTSHEQDNKNLRKLDIILKTEYSIEELYGMDLFDTSQIDNRTLKVLLGHEKFLESCRIYHFNR